MSAPVEHSKFCNERDGVSARCYSCDWRARGNQVSVNTKAVRHVRETGHERVEVCRSQWKIVELAKAGTS